LDATGKGWSLLKRGDPGEYLMMTFPKKKRINTELFDEGVSGLLKVGHRSAILQSLSNVEIK